MIVDCAVELAVEDAIHAHQRPKVEQYGETLLVVVKTAHHGGDRDRLVEVGELLVFVNPGLDRVVDDYERVAEALDGAIQEVEADVFDPARPSPAERIYMLEREVLELHRAVVPLMAEVDQLARGGFDAIAPRLRDYFRDVHDHLCRVGARIGGFRELLTSALQANLTQVAVRQNEDMRKISAWVAILAVPTMIAGIYGMNFEQMPELRWAYGYPAVLVVIAVACLLLHRRFKRAGWL